ncbi:MAG: thiamine-binding protein [Actinomycetota bacterium]|uniref:thiamine-binding protein n=1 Tax=Paenarthrobacter sp. PH39-S1 TaxID=3046204 RepID=UPI0024BAAEB9|nr:thiamine-binding protein [Paenarthrobacter sp. PH39-S1]MDJ0354936.1 thiamine-binding protein [Paenarthrobacter sp. PH39-S1]MDQ6739003.1 thiamine-binding protein [Actinomycetota bacterium]
MLVAFSVAPSGTPMHGAPTVLTGSSAGPVPDTDGTADDGSVHSAVAAAVKVVRESGLPNHTDSMFTTIEGDWDEVMEVVKRATEAVGAFGSRVSLVLKADIRPGHSGELTGKVDRLERALKNI